VGAEGWEKGGILYVFGDKGNRKLSQEVFASSPPTKPAVKFT
jgi:hypothetical protein